jgi:hypothetical protein
MGRRGGIYGLYRRAMMPDGIDKSERRGDQNQRDPGKFVAGRFPSLFGQAVIQQVRDKDGGFFKRLSLLAGLFSPFFNHGTATAIAPRRMGFKFTSGAFRELARYILIDLRLDVVAPNVFLFAVRRGRDSNPRYGLTRIAV